MQGALRHRQLARQILRAYAPARVTYRAFGFEQEGIGLGQVARRQVRRLTRRRGIDDSDVTGHARGLVAHSCLTT
jgi:hypothetical protein